jgi:phage terminase large subunit-like protein
VNATFRLPKHLRGDKALEARYEAAAARVAEAVRLNPLYAYNNPELSSKVHHKQLAFNRVKAPPLGTKAMIAGGRSGKTYCTLADDVIQLVPRDEVPPHLIECKKFEPPIDIWIGAPKYAKHEDTILPLLRKLIPKNQLRDSNFDKSYSSQARMLRLNCGSTVGLKTYDQDVDAWASAAIHRVHWDEEPNNSNGRRMRSEARQRLVSTQGDEILGMTPILGISTWANDEIYERRHEPGIIVHGMSMSDNPWNDPVAVESFLSGLTPEERRAREHGEFVHFGGLFFEEFREGLHVRPAPPIKELRGMEIVVSIDPGLVHTGVTWSAWDSDNAGVLFSEFNPPKTNVPEIAAEIRRRNAEWQLPEPIFVIDPSYRNLTTEIHADAVQASYAREEIYCQPGNNDRRAGILEIKKRLQAVDAEGKPHPTLLYAEPDERPYIGVPELIKQTERYRRNPDAADEWQAVPQDAYTRFDLVDSKRYGVMSRTWEIPDGPAERPTDSFEYGFEPALDLEDFQLDAAPMGDMS